MANTTKPARVATPKANTPAPVDSVELGKAIGARIKLITAAPQSQTFEGTLFTACPILNVVAINTRPAATGDSGDYHMIPISRIQSFHTISLASSQQQQQQLPPVDTKRLKEREKARIAQQKEQAADRGKGVSKEAQAIYDSLKRVNIPMRWHNTEMIAHEAVIISPPYRPEDCKGSAQKVQVLNQVKKVLEGERRKLSEREKAAGGARKGG